MYNEPGMQGSGNYTPLVVAAAKAFVRAGAGESKTGFKSIVGGRADAGGQAVLNCSQEDKDTLETGFFLAEYDPTLMAALSGEL